MTFISPILALVGIIGSIYFVFNFPAETFDGFLDTASMVFLGIMPPSVMLLSHNLRDFLVGFQTLFSSLFGNTAHRAEEIINVLTRASAMVRSDGIGSLVSIRNQIRYEFLREAISLIVNDFSPDEIRHNLTNKVNAKQSRMALAANLFENMAKVSPGVGMMGTLIGLISMMANLEDPTKIGGGMALAMITTLYGLLLGTILYAPCSEKIILEAERALEADLMVLEGVLSLKNKKSSVHMKDIMSTYGATGGSKAKAPAGGGKR